MAPQQPSSARDQVRDIVPALVDLSERVLFGEVWERPGLSKRDRSLITCATLIALGREKQLVGHLQRALDNGLKQSELSEVITHLAFYAGWPAAMTAALGAIPIEVELARDAAHEVAGAVSRWSAYPPILSVIADIAAWPSRAKSGSEQMQQCEAKITRLLGSCSPGSLIRRPLTRRW